MDPPIPLPPNFPLPQLHAHLSQFIHPRSSAHHIRQAVSAYFSDLAESTEHGGIELHPPTTAATSPIDPTPDVGREAYEKEIDGLLGRGTYLGPGQPQPPLAVSGGTEKWKMSTSIPKWGGGGGSLGKSSGAAAAAPKPTTQAITEGRFGGERLRRDYLLALRENILAKQEYDSIASSIPTDYNAAEGEELASSDEEDDIEGIWNEEGEFGLRPNAKDGAREFLDLYLSTHLLGRQFAKLGILQHYVKEFPVRNEEGGGGESGVVDLPQPPQPPPPSVVLATGGGAAEEDAHAKILLPLEKAMFTVYNELQVEKERLECVKKEVGFGSEGESGGVAAHVDPRKKRIALERTREELIRWMEERLSHSATAEDEEARRPQTTEQKEGGEGNIHQKVIADIEAIYSSYLKSRATLVSLIQQSIALSSSHLPPPTSSTTNTTTTITTTTTINNPSTPSSIPSTPTLPLLPFLTTHLPSLVHTQKSLLLTRTHISTTLSAQKDSLYRTLTRLAQNSHLLSPYLHSGAISLEGRSPADIARYWEEIGKARRKALMEEVGGKMDAAKGKLGGVEARMGEVKGLVQLKDREEEDVEKEEVGGKGGRGGIPVKSGRGGRGAKRGVVEEREKEGLWVGLGGGVGVIGDGI
ncbi:hypothetical protein EV426DRAFT_641655 [Tirmania nivea]|nr:hypothetical protein EV426DRAFT_641655 [Tirmania nivea]